MLHGMCLKNEFDRFSFDVPRGYLFCYTSNGYTALLEIDNSFKINNFTHFLSYISYVITI